MVTLSTVTSSPAASPALLTDADVLQRVHDLVRHAIVDGRLWLFFVDGDGEQVPTVVPIDDLPPLPHEDLLPNLGAVLRGVADGLVTELGPGSVVCILERLGPETTGAADRAWASALVRTCHEVDVGLRGVFLASSAGVRRLC